MWGRKRSEVVKEESLARVVNYNWDLGGLRLGGLISKESLWRSPPDLLLDHSTPPSPDADPWC